MFNFSFYPYARWLGDGSLDDVPGFNIAESEVLPGNSIAVTGKDLRAALDAVLAGTPVSSVQKPSIGCNIKWKPGNEPSYFQ